MRSHNFSKFSLLALIGLLSSSNAWAACPNVEGAFVQKMKEYRAYREQNLIAYGKLLAQEVSCKTKGALVSGSIAKDAKATSCQAAGDASRMNSELASIGVSCESTFKERHELQVKLRAAFVIVQDDLESAVEFMNASPILAEFCGRELGLGKKMVSAFLKLENEIVIVEARSLAGQRDYGKFKEAAVQLQAVTAATSRNCGGTLLADGKSAAVKPVSGTYAAGAKAVPVGGSTRAPSDITGTDKAIQKAAGSAAVAHSE